MKLSSEQIFYLNQLETATGKNAKDCIIDAKTISFLVPKNNMAAVIGKHGSTAKKLCQKLKKRVQFFEFDDDVKNFLGNAFGKAKISQVEVFEKDGEKTARITAQNMDKRLILGNQKRFKTIKEIAKRNYRIMDIRV